MEYLKRDYPTIITIGRFGKRSLVVLKKTFFGISGIAVIIVAGLYIAAALIESARWYLVGVASALLLLGGGLLALSQARFMLSRFLANQTKQISDIRKQVSDMEKQMSDIKKTLDASQGMLATMNAVNSPLFQTFNRRLTNEDLERFARDWVPKLGLDLNVRALGYMAHHICLAEDTCLGRLAGDIEDMLLRILVARSIKEPELNILEIGTLFGVSIAIIHENCRGFFAGVHVTVIDPLKGYYDKTLDSITMMPVTCDIFTHNMQRMNIPTSDYTIIDKLSTEKEAVEQASKKRYNLLIIDGDHSYSGVKNDFFNYGHLVEPGGCIIFDNYHDPNWPGITDFVDKEVSGLPSLDFVGGDGITAIFRVISTEDYRKS